MYNNGTFQYLDQLWHYIQQQEKKIQNLSESVRELRNELNQLKGEPKTKIEKIEYKFDQLKVERLEGTLNIGLNPLTSEQIEQFDVNQNALNVNPAQQQLQQQLLEQCREDINYFLNEECTGFIKQAEAQYQLKLDDVHRNHIIQDIRKQIDSRIQYYLNNYPLTEQDSLLDKKQELLTKVKQDVENSILHFLNHLPKD